MKRSLYVIPALLILSVMMIGMVMAANTATLNKPAGDARISGTYTLNVTLDTNTLNMTNATFYYKLPGGSWVQIANVVNTTAQQLEWTTTLATTSLVDDEALQFNVTMKNSTGSVLSSSNVTGVAIDNGAPTAAFSTGTTANGFSILLNQQFTVGSAADSTIGIHNCTVTMNSQTKDITSVTSQACDNTAYSPSDFGITAENDYTYTITVTDGNGNQSTTSARSIEIKLVPGGGSSTVMSEADTADVQDQQTEAATEDKGVFTRISEGISNFFERIARFFADLF